METLTVLGVDCDNCAANVKKALKGNKGIKEIDVILPLKKALVTFDPSLITKKDITDKVENYGFDVQ